MEQLQQNQAAADAESYGLGAGGGAEFAEDGSYVEFCRVVGNVEASGDFFVGQSGGEHLENFALAARQRLGKLGQRLRCWRGNGEGGGDFRGMYDHEARGRGSESGG